MQHFLTAKIVILEFLPTRRKEKKENSYAHTTKHLIEFLIFSTFDITMKNS